MILTDDRLWLWAFLILIINQIGGTDVFREKRSGFELVVGGKLEHFNVRRAAKLSCVLGGIRPRYTYNIYPEVISYIIAFANRKTVVHIESPLTVVDRD